MKTQEQFEQEVNTKYPDIKILGKYTGREYKVLVGSTQCEHEWNVTPRKLLAEGVGSKCPKCRKVHNTKTHEQYEKELSQSYPNIQLLGQYINSVTKISIKYKGCQHLSHIIPASLTARGTNAYCKLCAEHPNKSRFESLLPKEYVPLEDYRGAHHRLKIKSTVCGHEWEIEPNTFLNKGIGTECPMCKSLMQKKDIIDTLKYLGVTTLEDYETTKSDVLVRYDNCGHTKKIYLHNLIHYGSNLHCSECNKSTSRAEKELLDYIKSIYNGWIVENDRNILEGQELDIVLPDLGLAFEFNGNYWHSDKHKSKYYHAEKTTKAKEEGYQLVHIFEDMKKDLVKSKIRSLLGLNVKIPARKCVIREVPFPRTFMEDNHLQGAGSPTGTNYALFYKDEMVAVMTFGKPRFNTKYDYELVRFCSLQDITVVGGASKLLNHFRKNHSGSIISYSNRLWSNGNLYKSLGFKYSHTSDPSYRYYKGSESYSRYECQKAKLLKRYPNTKGTTEQEIMELEGFYRVYDSGNDVWVME